MRHYKVEKSVHLDQLEEVLNRNGLLNWHLDSMTADSRLVFTLVLCQEVDSLSNYLFRKSRNSEKVVTEEVVTEEVVTEKVFITDEDYDLDYNHNYLIPYPNDIPDSESTICKVVEKTSKGEE